MFQPHADIVFASLSGSDVARQYGLARRPECLIESVSVSEIPLPKKLGHEGMPGKVAEKGNPQNVHDDLRGGYLSWKPPDECLAAAGQYQRFARTERNAVAKVLELLEEETGPVILMGDFNMEPNDPILAPLLAKMEDAADKISSNSSSFPADNPEIKIDYILTKNAPVLCAEIPAIIASDHRPHTATVEVGE